MHDTNMHINIYISKKIYKFDCKEKFDFKEKFEDVGPQFTGLDPSCRSRMDLPSNPNSR